MLNALIVTSMYILLRNLTQLENAGYLTELARNLVHGALQEHLPETPV